MSKARDLVQKWRDSADTAAPVRLDQAAQELEEALDQDQKSELIHLENQEPTPGTTNWRGQP